MTTPRIPASVSVWGTALAHPTDATFVVIGASQADGRETLVITLSRLDATTRLLNQPAGQPSAQGHY